MARLLVSMILVALIVAVGCISSHAQSERRQEMRKRIELLAMWQMMKELDLDEETAQKIFAIRKRFVDERKAIRAGLRESFRELRQIVDHPPDQASEERLRELLKNIRSKRKELMQLKEKQYEDVAGVLTLRQQAKLVIFLKDFRRRIRSLMRGDGDMEHRGPGMRQGGQGLGRGPFGRGFGPHSNDRLPEPPAPGEAPRLPAGPPGQAPEMPPGPPAPGWDDPSGDRDDDLP